MAKQAPKKPETLMEKLADKVDHVLHPENHDESRDVSKDDIQDQDEFSEQQDEIEKYSHPKFGKFKNEIEGIK